MKKTAIILATAAVLLGGACKKNEEGYDPHKIKPSKKEKVNSNAFDVEFKPTASNIKTIHVKLNGANSYDAIFDTGCSNVLISNLEAYDMLKQGTLSPDDFVGEATSTIADGTVSVNAVINLREVTVIDTKGQAHTLHDIRATVIDNPEASILIGNSVIDNLAKKSYTIDLSKHIIRFE